MSGGTARFFVYLRSVFLCGMLMAVGVASSAAANYKVVPSSITFSGITLVGLKSGSQTVTVTNTSSSNVTITSFSLSSFYIFQLD
jgi:hypothetical protein